MKRITVWFIVLAAVSVLALAACGGADGAPAQVAPAEEAAALQALPLDVDVQTTYELKDNPDVYLLDVREQEEYDEKHIPGITLLPMSSIESRLDEIPTDKTVIVTCRTGNRSNQVTQFLRANGFDNAHNMTGGIVAWEEAGLPVEFPN